MLLLSTGFAVISLLAVCHMLHQLATHNNKRTKSGDLSAVVAIITIVVTIITNAFKP
jgi:hypothetical protein